MIARANVRHLFQLTVALIFLSVFSFGTSSPAIAATTQEWEVAVIFLGAEETADYQADIDNDIRDMAKLAVGPRFRLSVYRDFASRSVVFQPDPKASTSSPWDDLFAETAAPGIPVFGRLESRAKEAGEGPVTRNLPLLAKFLQDAFRNPEAKRMLVIWGHGFGVDGMKGVPLPALRELLEKNIAKTARGSALDILWFDACFMAGIEVAYEFQEVARAMIASETAEFSAGVPFESLAELASPARETSEDPVATASYLAREFIESYSYLRQGNQRDAALTSPATVSVVDLEKVSGVVDKIAALTQAEGRLSSEARKALAARASERETGLEKQADLVGFLRHLRQSKLISPAADTIARETIFLLEGFRARRYATDWRVRVEPPPGYASAWLVYGYHNWIYGAQDDEFTRAKLAPEMEAAGYIAGAFGLDWPYLVVDKPRALQAFGVDRNKFHYYFVDPATGKKISDDVSTIRWPERELFEFAAENDANPVRYSAYTQGAGARAERFYGISIFDRSLGSSPALLNSRFGDATLWGAF